MAQDQPGDLRFFARIAGQPPGAVMIAGDPHQPPPLRKPVCQLQRRAVEPFRPGIIVETVTQCPDFGGVKPFGQRYQPLERGLAVERWQHLPAARKPAGLFQMQIGNQQGAPVRPEQGPFGQSQKALTGEQDVVHAAALPAWCRRPQAQKGKISCREG